MTADEAIAALEQVEKNVKELEEQRYQAITRQVELEEMLEEFEDDKVVTAWKKARAEKRKAERKKRNEEREAERLLKQRRRVYKYGGCGVDVKLHSCHPGKMTDQGVYWGTRRQCSPSYVLAEGGPFTNIDGKAVALVSINGSGDIRWTVEPGCHGADADAVAAFGLTS